MANKTPLKISQTYAVWQQFESGDTVGPEHGGTGKTLTDLTGQAGKYVKVNSGETGYEFGTPAGGGGGGGVETVTGPGVDNTDAANPVVNARPYKVYTALISQSGSDNPVVIELENTTGATFDYSRAGDGSYRCDLSAGALTADKTVIFFSGSNTGPTPAYYNARWVSDSQFRFETWDSSTASLDGLLTLASIEIRIYP